MVYFEHGHIMRSVLTGPNAAVQCTGKKKSLKVVGRWKVCIWP